MSVQRRIVLIKGEVSDRISPNVLSDPKAIHEVAEQSKRIEENTYIERIAELYDLESQRAEQLFDEAAAHTDSFHSITKEEIRADPRIVMILRYLIKPTISQMKFGQYVGVRSTGNYEDFDVNEVATPNHETAAAIAEFVNDNLHPEKVPWLFEDGPDEDGEYAHTRRWIGDKIAEQTAETRYRNWRAGRQEQATIDALEDAGYIESDHTGEISSIDDLDVGTYVDESKITGSDTQKADVIARPSATRLVFIEAKAIGVALDAYKRTKEIRDKASAWCAEFENAEVIAVIEGGLDGRGVQKLMRHVDVYFEHRLNEHFIPDLREKLES